MVTINPNTQPAARCAHGDSSPGQSTAAQQTDSGKDTGSRLAQQSREFGPAVKQLVRENPISTAVGLAIAATVTLGLPAMPPPEDILNGPGLYAMSAGLGVCAGIGLPVVFRAGRDAILAGANAVFS